MNAWIPTAAVIGGGPAGLMAAEVLSRAAVRVTVYDQMPAVGRKLLMAGQGGLNLTHAEPLPRLIARYGPARPWLEPIVSAYPPEALIAWCNDLGQPTFTGSSARIFPRAMKASPLLRAWLRRLGDQGVEMRTRHRWAGWDPNGSLRFRTANGEIRVTPIVTVLATGGASWPRLGSDAGWVAYLADSVTAFRPTNCGFQVDWTQHFRSRFAGRPLKRLALRFGSDTVRGEAMIAASGLEGGVIYALSARLRDAILAQGRATIELDLRPDLTLTELGGRLQGPRRGQSLANTLRKQAGLAPEAIGLVQEALHHGATDQSLAVLIKALPIRLLAPFAIERAISCAGGLRADALDESLMLRQRPGVFAAGEMLDWEAPTGGYLLQACCSTAVAAADGALAWLHRQG
ncbi:TIGR03862 family flavoprotein [Rhodopila sp.]|uniref:TIGR03862 family flavoprotein n=1 Tax=Rhodopila sp. TaxID=2480087 RepID=UPI003D0A062B